MRRLIGESVAAAKAWCAEHLGPVDILVSCAGIGGDKAFADLTVAEWDRMIGVLRDLSRRYVRGPPRRGGTPRRNSETGS